MQCPCTSELFLSYILLKRKKGAFHHEMEFDFFFSLSPSPVCVPCVPSKIEEKRGRERAEIIRTNGRSPSFSSWREPASTAPKRALRKEKRRKAKKKSFSSSFVMLQTSIIFPFFWREMYISSPSLNILFGLSLSLGCCGWGEGGRVEKSMRQPSITFIGYGRALELGSGGPAQPASQLVAWSVE